MLSIQTTKIILNKPDISDEEAELIRNQMRSLAEIAFETFIDQKIKPELRGRFKNEDKQ